MSGLVEMLAGLLGNVDVGGGGAKDGEGGGWGKDDEMVG